MALRTVSACCGAAPATPRNATRPSGGGRLELEPARPGRAVGDAGVVGLPRRVHRGRRAVAARRRRAADVAQDLEHLVDQSLLQVADTPTGAVPVLEPVREFSTAHREAAGETDQVVQAPVARSLGTRLRGGAPRCGLRGRPSRRWSGSGPSRTTSPRRSYSSPRRTAAPSRPRRPCSRPVDHRVQLPAHDEAGRGRPWCCPHFGPGRPPQATRTALALCAIPRSSSRGPARCARWSPCNGCPRPRPDTMIEPRQSCSAAAPRDRSALYAVRRRRAAGGRCRQRRRHLLRERGRPGQQRERRQAVAGSVQAAGSFRTCRRAPAGSASCVCRWSGARRHGATCWRRCR